MIVEILSFKDIWVTTLTMWTKRAGKLSGEKNTSNLVTHLQCFHEEAYSAYTEGEQIRNVLGRE